MNYKKLRSFLDFTFLLDRKWADAMHCFVCVFFFFFGPGNHFRAIIIVGESSPLPDIICTYSLVHRGFVRQTHRKLVSRWWGTRAECLVWQLCNPTTSQKKNPAHALMAMKPSNYQVGWPLSESQTMKLQRATKKGCRHSSPARDGFLLWSVPWHVDRSQQALLSTLPACPAGSSTLADLSRKRKKR